MSNSADAREQALEVAERLAPPGPAVGKRMFTGAGLSSDDATFALGIGGRAYLGVDHPRRTA